MMEVPAPFSGDEKDLDNNSTLPCRSHTVYAYQNQEKLTEFAQKHPNSRSALNRWRALIEQENFGSIAELHEKFPHADPVRVKVQRRQSVGIPVSIEAIATVFNIGGNKARLIVSIQYQLQRVTIHKVLTHAEYDNLNPKSKLLL